MTRTAVAITVSAAAIALAGCGASETTTATTAPAPTTTQPAATPPAAPMDLRASTCRDLLPMVAQTRNGGGDGAVTKAVEDAIAWMPTTPEWTSLSEEDRQAAIDGVRDAATGTCG
ncbi:hypothetical protein JK358_12610 [Nocardia sp. 2]|uniref:DUF732 domain-containing protein n=1 Tax=Nocardia acididurans TaxID=2802282 RepID=A0ABS1M4Y4_9NOCA|nr:hypothetical protein [Nocardia acididurans]MBL1075235.1 hypothetical protein [Nocardia acididurans]